MSPSRGICSVSAREKRERKRNVEPMFIPAGSRGSPIPPTISPRIDWLK